MIDGIVPEELRGNFRMSKVQYYRLVEELLPCIEKKLHYAT